MKLLIYSVALIVVAAFIFFGFWCAMLLWNDAIVPLGVPVVTYWQTVEIVVLLQMVFVTPITAAIHSLGKKLT